MTEKKYNGWTNYETWAVNLWLTNEESTYNYWMSEARDVARSHGDDTGDARNDRENACIELAERVKEQHENSRDELDLGATLWADLLNGAMSDVNWYEIAEHLIDDDLWSEVVAELAS